LVSRSADVISLSPNSNNNGRDIGVIVSGGIALDSLRKRNIIEYFVGVYNGDGINKGDNNVDKDFSGRLLFSAIKGLQLGGSYYKGLGSYGTDLTVERIRDRIVGEIYYFNKWVSFKQNIYKARMIQSAEEAITPSWRDLLFQRNCS